MGPMRRLGDQVETSAPEGDDEENDLKTQLERARVAALEACARGFKSGDANLSFGSKEMLRYLRAQGATARLDPEVVRTHIAALHQLVHLPHALLEEREKVAQSLKRMVDKKLRQSAA